MPLTTDMPSDTVSATHDAPSAENLHYRVGCRFDHSPARWLSCWHQTRIFTADRIHPERSGWQIKPGYRYLARSTLMEAMSAGLPCVATYLGAVTVQMQHGVSGFVVPRGGSDVLQQLRQSAPWKDRYVAVLGLIVASINQPCRFFSSAGKLPPFFQ